MALRGRRKSSCHGPVLLARSGVLRYAPQGCQTGDATASGVAERGGKARLTRWRGRVTGRWLGEQLVSDTKVRGSRSDILDTDAVLAALSEVDLPPDYRPSEDEPFMNPNQLAYFKRRLLLWKAELLGEAKATLDQLKAEPLQEPDATDLASSETDWAIELRARDRQRKLIAKIDAALERIETGEYGWCEISGEPISLARLEARPIATMTLEAQERHERTERISRDD